MNASLLSGPLPILVAVVLSVILGATPHGLPQTLADQAIETVKHLSVSRLDSSLPEVKFEAWFARVVGRESKIAWELNDCGEQTGDPKSDALRDIPMCVGVSADLPDGRKAGVLVHVGTSRKGISGAPTVFDAYYVEVSGKHQQTKRLHNLEDSLRKGGFGGMP